MNNRPALTPGALRDAPALIESVFPAQKVSFEAQKERKSQASQTLTALGSFWKGRKPLILVRAVVLGSLLPSTTSRLVATSKQRRIFASGSSETQTPATRRRRPIDRRRGRPS